MNRDLTPIYTRTYISRMGIATRIDRMMSERKIKGQSALSRLSGVPQPTIARVLKGRTDTPELSTVKKLAAALGVTTTWLADGPDDPVQYAGESATAVQLAASTVDEVAERASALREMQIAQATAILAGLSDSALSKALGLLQDLRGEPTEDGAKSDDLPMFSRGKSLHEYLGSGSQPFKPEKSHSRKAK